MRLWIKRSGLLMIGAVVGSLVTVVFTDEFSERLQATIFGAVAVTQYQGIRLGMTMDEVRYVNGLADEYFDQNDVLDWGGKMIVSRDQVGKGHYKDKSDSDFHEWSWTKAARVDVAFNKETMRVEQIGCYDSKRSGECAIYGLKTGDREEKVEAYLGQADSKKIDKSGVLTMDYKRLNLRLWLVRKEIYMIAITNRFD